MCLLVVHVQVAIHMKVHSEGLSWDFNGNFWKDVNGDVYYLVTTVPNGLHWKERSTLAILETE